jgi:hypothetical protein
MATNFAENIAIPQLAERKARLSFEHRFFLTVAVLFPVITVIGFAPSYYLKTAFNSPPLPSTLVHVHGLVMSLWIVLFAVQAYLISSKRIKLHMTLGTFGVVLAAVIVVVGAMTAVAAGARNSGFPGFHPLVFMMIPLAGVLIFAAIFGAAIYYRKNAANHKRLMLLTVLAFLSPSTSRLPFPFIPELGAWWILGVPSFFAILILTGDTYINGKVNRVFLIATLFLVASGPIQMAIARTEAWMQFATWLTTSI